MLYRVHLAWAEFDLATLVVIGTDCIYSYKSNYHDHDGTRYINARWIIHVKDECPVGGGLHSWQMLQEREDRIGVRVVVFNATIINISFITWWSVLIVEGTGETYWQTLSHNVVSSKPRLESELFPNLDNYYIYYIIIDTYHLLRPLYHEDVPGNVGLFQDNQTDLYFWVELSLYFWGVRELLPI